MSIKSNTSIVVALIALNVFLVIAVFIFALSAVNSPTKIVEKEKIIESSPSIVYRTPQTQPNKFAKYILLFIGDGMGLPQINAAEIYNSQVKQKEGKIGVKKLNINSFPSQALTTTYSSNSYITDSAAAGTAIATGFKTNSGIISKSVDKLQDYKTIAEYAKELGMKVGIVSSVSIDHATPACFYAHQDSRNMYHEIGHDLANSDFDFFGGGGLKKPDGPLGNVYEKAKKNGFKLVTNIKNFVQLKPGDGRVFAVNSVLDGSKALPYEIDRADADISLREYTEKAIEMLDNENGFFLMVEGGKIDWACHANDATSSIYDTIAFSEAVEEGLKFYREHQDETLIVVTSDHECGGMTVGFSGTGYSAFYDRLKYQKISYTQFEAYMAEFREMHTLENSTLEDVLPKINDMFGLIYLNQDEVNQLKIAVKRGDEGAAERLGRVLTEFEVGKLRDAFKQTMLGKELRSKDQQTALLYGGYDPLTVSITHILNNKAGIGWTSFTHTGVQVPTFAIGVDNQLFTGSFDNTDIFKKMKKVIFAKTKQKS